MKREYSIRNKEMIKLRVHIKSALGCSWHSSQQSAVSMWNFLTGATTRLHARGWLYSSTSKILSPVTSLHFPVSLREYVRTSSRYSTGYLHPPTRNYFAITRTSMDSTLHSRSFRFSQVSCLANIGSSVRPFSHRSITYNLRLSGTSTNTWYLNTRINIILVFQINFHRLQIRKQYENASPFFKLERKFRDWRAWRILCHSETRSGR